MQFRYFVQTQCVAMVMIANNILLEAVAKIAGNVVKLSFSSVLICCDPLRSDTTSNYHLQIWFKGRFSKHAISSCIRGCMMVDAYHVVPSYLYPLSEVQGVRFVQFLRLAQ